MGNLLKLTLILFTFALGNDIFVMGGTTCSPEKWNTDEYMVGVTNTKAKKALGFDIVTCPPSNRNQDLEYCCHLNNKYGCCDLTFYLLTGLLNNFFTVVFCVVIMVIIFICCCVYCLRRR